MDLNQALAFSKIKYGECEDWCLPASRCWTCRAEEALGALAAHVSQQQAQTEALWAIQRRADAWCENDSATLSEAAAIVADLAGLDTTRRTGV
jgi:hypothetical protein